MLLGLRITPDVGGVVAVLRQATWTCTLWKTRRELTSEHLAHLTQTCLPSANGSVTVNFAVIPLAVENGTF